LEWALKSPAGEVAPGREAGETALAGDDADDEWWPRLLSLRPGAGTARATGWEWFDAEEDGRCADDVEGSCARARFELGRAAAAFKNNNPRRSFF
jgi:hypothetical protein